MTDKIRIGICGTGSMGVTRGQALMWFEDARAVRGWSRSPLSRRRFIRQTGGESVESWRALCASPDLDAIMVCTPNDRHEAQAMAALEAGKHVLVETPLALSLDGARALADAAESRDLVLHHGAKWRFHPDHAQHIANLQRVGSLVSAVDTIELDYGPDRAWYASAAQTGGARVFLPYLMVDWLEAFGPVARAVGSESVEEGRQEATIKLTFERGGEVEIRHAFGPGVVDVNTRQVVGKEGSIETLPEGTRVFTQGASREALVQRKVDIVQCECRAFVDEIQGVRDHRADLQRDLRAWELVEEAFGVR